MNPVNVRLGRRIAAKAEKKVQRQKVNQLVTECAGWKRDLAQSWLDVNPDDFEDAYTSGEHSK